MNFIPEPFEFFPVLQSWGTSVGTLLLVALASAFLFSLIVMGRRGPASFVRQLRIGLQELTFLSFRRIWSIAMLTFRQAVRRKALLIFVIFAVIFMFAGWFLQGTEQKADLQVRIYISFVLTAITWLTLPIMLLLSCWGLPEDIKARSLHTVVTKPVKRSEIVIGRIAGYGMVGTVILVIMSSVGYVWILRQVPENAQDLLTCRDPLFGRLSFRDSEGNPSKGINVGDAKGIRRSGFVNGGTRSCGIFSFYGIDESYGDRMEFEARLEAFRTYKGVKIDQPLQCQVRIVKELRERVALGLGSYYSDFSSLTSAIRNESYVSAGRSMSILADRVLSGEIRPQTEKEWNFLALGFEDYSRVMGPFVKKPGQAEWVEEAIEASNRAAEACKKQDPEKSVESRIQWTEMLSDSMKTIGKSFEDHPTEYKTWLVDFMYQYPVFGVKEFSFNDKIFIDRKLKYQIKGSEEFLDGDLYETFLHGDELQVQVYCMDHNQLLGMARPDVFIRLKDKPFYVGYAKAIFSLWLMTILTITIGVTASCFLKGPVATFAVLFVLVLGTIFHSFMEKQATGQEVGGGPLQSFVRIYDHGGIMMNFNNELFKKIDRAIAQVLSAILHVLPDLNSFGMSERLANGFDVPWKEKTKAVLPSLLTTMGFFFPCVVLAYFSLKLRELESK